MGKRVVFVLFLGGCFNFGNGSDAGCAPLTPGNCQDLSSGGARCDPSLPACSPSACECLSGVGGWTVQCPGPDLSVPRDLAAPPRDLSRLTDGGDGRD